MTDIDDLSDSEQYNDEDFVVGTPSPNKHSAEGNTNNNNDVDDEQHAQKVNGQIEQLKMTVRDLEEQLETEKRNHERTKKALVEQQSSSSSSSSTGKNADSVHQKLGKELLSACTKLSLQSSIYCDVASSTMTEEEALRILNAIVDRKSKDDNTAAAVRPNTTQSTKSEKQYSSYDGMRKRIEDLEQELVMAMNAAEDIKALKAKLLMMVDRIRSEKDTRDRLNYELKSTRKKLSILTDHIEKLMGHLKHEAAAKIRALENLREMEKEKLHANQKCIKLVRKGVAKDRLILELREGGKILEDQLRLMDEKYLELRTKLDFARESSEKRIKKADRTASDLRVKFALLGHTGSLDALPMPNHSIAGSQPFDGTGSLGSFDGDQYTADGQSYYTADTKSSKMTGKKKKPKSAPKPKILETEEEREEEVQRLLEKMRLKNGGAGNWNEEKARELVESRGHAK